MIPQCNPLASYRSHQQAIDAAIARVLQNGWYILGQEVEAFEQEFAAWLGTAHAVGVANGTDAIELALRAAGIGLGDTVATVSHTAVATAAGIQRAGATPVFVDIEADYFTMDAERLAATCAAEPGIRAVVVVHLYGQMADMPAILDVARTHGLVVIEDCAQAHGASLNGRKAGTWGDFGTFSFYPTKNLGALGDGGTVVTNDAGAATRLRALRQYGWDERRESLVAGVNSRLDEMQAAILRVKLRLLDEDNRRRHTLAAQYRRGLQHVPSLILPREREGCTHVYHQFVVQYPHRDALASGLSARGVATSIHYPMPVHQQTAYLGEAYRPLDLPVTERKCGLILSLPMFPELPGKDAGYIVESISDVIAADTGHA